MEISGKILISAVNIYVRHKAEYNGVCGVTDLLGVHIIKVILHKLYTGSEVCLVELIGDVPAEGSKLSPLLNRGVQEGHRVQHRLPLGQVGVVEHLLSDPSVRPLYAGLYTLRRLVGELDTRLQ